MAKLVIKQTGVAGVTESDGLNYTVLPVYTWANRRAETQLRQPFYADAQQLRSVRLSL
jgi:hypothetical protein